MHVMCDALKRTHTNHGYFLEQIGVLLTCPPAHQLPWVGRKSSRATSSATQARGGTRRSRSSTTRATITTRPARIGSGSQWSVRGTTCARTLCYVCMHDMYVCMVCLHAWGVCMHVMCDAFKHTLANRACDVPRSAASRRGTALITRSSTIRRQSSSSRTRKPRSGHGFR